MPIHVPGRRDRRGRRTGGAKRNVVASLPLTAMVDMFTVLLVFLLQNYKEQNVYLKFYQDVQLPEASQIKELQPAHVISISRREIRLDEKVVASYQEVAAQADPLVEKLYQPLSQMIAADMKPRKTIQGTIHDLVKGGNSEKVDSKAGKITIQAEKSLDFGTVKKVMYTVSEAGGLEMNFAVIRVDDALAPKTK
jgi:biopolymer transport protein ExbD